MSSSSSRRNRRGGHIQRDQSGVVAFIKGRRIQISISFLRRNSYFQNQFPHTKSFGGLFRVEMMGQKEDDDEEGGAKLVARTFLRTGGNGGDAEGGFVVDEIALDDAST